MRKDIAKAMRIADVQKKRFDAGCVVYNNNNQSYAVVVSGHAGSDSDPCSIVIEKTIDGFMVHTPPNRALIPVGKFVDLSKIIPKG